MHTLTRRTKLLQLKDMPLWRQDNKYILRGYRPLSNSYVESIKSLSYVHNQTVNIYTHLLGLVFFGITAYIFRHTLFSRYHTASSEDFIVLLSFFTGVFACLGFSSAFHTFSNHSEDIYKQWLVLDFLGILCLILGSWIPGVYYGYYCQRSVMGVYLTLISTLSIVCALVCLTPYCQTPEWRHFRTVMFLSLGLFGFFPMVHAATEFGILQAHQQMGWGWFILEAVFYISGAAVYANKHPEKARPGVFDIFGSSHQIFHVLVLLGALSHLTGVLKAFDYNHSPLTRLC